jgi:hypothetical protein
MYEQGTGVSQDYGRALKWYLSAANLGRPEAQYKVGYFYEKGFGVAVNKAEALAWYQKSGALGYPDAKDAMKSLMDE